MAINKNKKTIDATPKEGKDDDFSDFKDIDFDAEFNIDGLSGVEADDRKPNSVKVAKDLAKEAGKGFMDSLVKETAKKSLPESYEASHVELVDYKDFIHEELIKNKNIIATSLSKLAVETKKALPVRIKLLDKILDKLTQDQEQIRRETEEQVQESLIQSNLSSIFDKQLEFTAKLEAERNVKEDENIRREIVSNKISSDLLVSINNNLNTQTAFSLQIAKEYYRKSLELQFKTYFIQADMLKTQKEHFKAFSVQFDSIVKNTGLPEFVKLRNTERLSEILRTQATTDIYKNFMNKSEYIQNVKKRTSKYISDKVSTATSAIDGLTEMASASNSASEMGVSDKGMIPKVLAGMFGSTIGGKIADKISPGIKSKIKDSKAVRTGDNLLKTLITSPTTLFKGLETKVGQKEEEYEGSDSFSKNILGKVLGGFKDFLSVTTPDRIKTEISDQQNILEFDQAAIFDNLVYKSITDVIPMYLSKILKENTDLRKMYYISNQNKLKGFTGSSELVYNYMDRSLTDADTFKTSVQNKLLASKTKSKHDNIARSLVTDFVYAKPDTEVGKKLSTEFKRDKESTNKKLVNYLTTAQNTLGANFSFEKAILERDKNVVLTAAIEKDSKLKELLSIIEAEYKAKLKKDSLGPLLEESYKDKFIDETSMYPIKSVINLFTTVSNLAGDTLKNVLTPREATVIAETFTNFIIKEGTDITSENIQNLNAFTYLPTKIEEIQDLDKDTLLNKIKVFRSNVLRIKNTQDTVLSTSLLALLGELNTALKSSIDINPEVFVKLNKYSSALFKGSLSGTNLTEGRLTVTKQDAYYSSEELREQLHVTHDEKVALDKQTKTFTVKEILSETGISKKLENIKNITTTNIANVTTSIKTFSDDLSKAKNPAEAAKIIIQAGKNIADSVENVTKKSYEHLKGHMESLTKIISEHAGKVTTKHINGITNHITNQVNIINNLIEEEKKAYETSISLYKDTVKKVETNVNIEGMNVDEVIEKEIAKRNKVHEFKIKILQETKNKLNKTKSYLNSINEKTFDLSAFRELLAETSNALKSYKDMYEAELNKANEK